MSLKCEDRGLGGAVLEEAERDNLEGVSGSILRDSLKIGDEGFVPSIALPGLVGEGVIGGLLSDSFE